jgi:hypothetical protein
MALKPRLVVFVDNINEGSRDVAFRAMSFANTKIGTLTKNTSFHTYIAI